MTREPATFRKVLIANRGEIACRIAATLREMGITPIMVHSEADAGALHVRGAAEAVAIGPAEPRASYLNGPALIEAAKKSGAEAIHPGYGFLAENAEFAEAVEAAGLVFIGPTPEQVRILGDKRAARALALKAGVAIVPGAEGADADALAREAKKIGYPVMVKAALGGGGKGMKAVADEAALREAAESAARLASAAFGDAAIYLEKRIERARHVEVQLLGDGRGQAIHLFERDCTLQRRHQKVIEESPSPAIDDVLRGKFAAAAVKLAKLVKYRGAGTAEFLVAPDGSFFFLEVNTRLQVEHPVTELITGIDLVRAQVAIAAQGRLPLAQGDVAFRGHAIEARLYAEDGARDFLPQAGDLVRVRWPSAPFVRVDAGVESGDTVTVHYDPILAKLIAWGPDRESARHRLIAALDDTVVHGVVTNLPFLRALVRAPDFERSVIDTEWIEREFLAGFKALATAPAPDLALVAAAIAEAGGPSASARSPATSEDGDAIAPDAFALGRWRHPGLS